MALFLKSSMPTLKITADFSLISGSSGKSSAGAPLMREEYLPAAILILLSLEVIFTGVDLGRLETNSARSLAGTVTTPSFEEETGR